MGRLIMWIRVTLVGLMTLALGCASALLKRDRVDIHDRRVLTGAPLGVDLVSPATDDQEAVLAVSAEMRDFLDTHVSRTTGRISAATT